MPVSAMMTSAWACDWTSGSTVPLASFGAKPTGEVRYSTMLPTSSWRPVTLKMSSVTCGGHHKFALGVRGNPAPIRWAIK